MYSLYLLLFSLGQFTNSSFSILFLKLGLAFSSLVDCFYSATLNATVEVGAYPLWQVTTNAFVTKSIRLLRYAPVIFSSHGIISV